MLKKLLLISVLVASLSFACQTKSKIPKPPSASVSATQLKVTASHYVFVAETQILSLSPSGEWLFGLKQDSICIYVAATLAEKVCVPWKNTLDPTSIAWSPDSTKVAFNEDWSKLIESDLWVLTVKSGVLIDLTNDNLEGDISTSLQRAKSQAKSLNLDSMPAWSPDGKTIAFVRSSYGDVKKTTICLISANGGNVTDLLIADDSNPLAVWHGMRWTPDGSKILFTMIILENTTGKNGIWEVDKYGKTYKQLVKEKEGWGYPALYDVAAQGDKALIAYPRTLPRAAQYSNLCFFEIVDLKTGALTPLIDPLAGIENPPTTAVYYSPLQAVFSPDGSKVLYVYNKAVEDQHVPQLAVRDLNSATEQTLETQKTIYTGEDVGATLFWAQNDTVYMMTGSGIGTLYTLGSQ